MLIVRNICSKKHLIKKIDLKKSFIIMNILFNYYIIYFLYYIYNIVTKYQNKKIL